MNVLGRTRIMSDTKHVTCQSHYTIMLAWDVNFSGLTLTLGSALWIWDNICIKAQSTACQLHLYTSLIESVDSSKDRQKMWTGISIYFNEFSLLCLWVLLLRTLKTFTFRGWAMTRCFVHITFPFTANKRFSRAEEEKTLAIWNSMTVPFFEGFFHQILEFFD